MITRLSDEAIVRAWELGVERAPLDRALALYANALPDAAWDTLLDAPIAERDAALLAMLRSTFGTPASAYAECPVCGEGLELPLDLDALVSGSTRSTASMHVCVGAFEVTFRLPSSRDVLTVSRNTSVREAADELARRCIVGVVHEGEAVSETELPSAALEAIAHAIELAAPISDIELALECVACAYGWAIAFDSASFLFRLVSARAKRVFDDVDCLARTYGWTEREVLALSPQRRDVYLSMATR